jgi:hypothetical protein
VQQPFGPALGALAVEQWRLGPDDQIVRETKPLPAHGRFMNRAADTRPMTETEPSLRRIAAEIVTRSPRP